MNLIKEILRKMSISDITRNVGKIKIESDKVSISVSNFMIKSRKDSNKFRMYFSNFDRFSSLYKGIPKELNCKLKCRNIPKELANKPVHYTIKNMNFDGDIDFSLEENTTITFKNCTFKGTIKINGKGNVVFKANTYHCPYIYGNTTIPFLDVETESVTFRDEDFYNSSKDTKQGRVYFGMKIIAKVVNIIRSQIDVLNPNNSIDITSDKVNVEESKIYPNEMTVDTKFFSLKHSRILGKDNEVDISAEKPKVENSKIACARIRINPKFLAALVKQCNPSNGLHQIQPSKTLCIENRNPIRI